MIFQLTKTIFSACHTIPNKNKPSDRPIVIRFTNRKAKINVLQNARKLKRVADPNNSQASKESQIFINEHLTTKNNMIAKKARYLRREGKIEKTWVKNCKIFIKYRATNGDDKMMVVKNISDLNGFLV